MSRLVAFGCSVTYGQGLPDCHVFDDTDTVSFKPGPNPSNHAWPNILARELSLECVNNGIPGASNKEILLKVLDTEFMSDDIVVFLWSYTQRSLVHENDQSIIKIIPSKFDTNKNFYIFHTEHDLIVQSIMDIHHANMFLLNKNIKVYNFYLDMLLSKSTLFNIIPEITFIPIYLVRSDFALDNMHPGIKSNGEIAKFFMKHISLCPD